jgi:hypothetical protein
MLPLVYISNLTRHEIDFVCLPFNLALRLPVSVAGILDFASHTFSPSMISIYVHKLILTKGLLLSLTLVPPFAIFVLHLMKFETVCLLLVSPSSVLINFVMSTIFFALCVNHLHQPLFTVSLVQV